MASMHEVAEGLLKVNAIGKATMRQFDETCLTPVGPLAGERKSRSKPA